MRPIPLLLLIVMPVLAPAVAASRGGPCDAPARHAFDFFLGDWDTYDVADTTTLVARNRVTRMVDGCAIREVYEQADGMRGESLSAYDAGRGSWHQTWVTNRGELLLLDGHTAGDTLRFAATVPGTAGDTTWIRVAWWPEGRAVRERAERSGNGGKRWAPLFDIVFRPHAEP